MSSLPLKAHIDGQQIVRDVPFELPTNSPLLVMLLEDSDSLESSQREWLKAAAGNDAFAFLFDPDEDIYTSEDGEPLCDELSQSLGSTGQAA